MAKVNEAVSERIYQIKRWLGVNEAPEGEATLNMGEATVMQNFRVTAGGALKKRAGSANVAGLLREYIISIDEENPKIVLTESAESTASFTMYPELSLDSVGKLSLVGKAVTVNLANAADYGGYYFMDTDGLIHKFVGVTAD